ncbi:MAG TPA: carboxylating nicotinate-nucleotide diphosphorylase [Acidimicrobiales bacterium]|nr:carboxylating nicotinate-nucleotide diphosphorylase [Acidimicrobiales bacterium]
MNKELRATLAAIGIDAVELQGLVDVALLEDLRYGPDVTSDAIIALDQPADAEVVAREPGVVCGVTVAIAVLEAAGFPLSGVTVIHQDGDEIDAHAPVLHLCGPLRPLLLAERTMLNFMTHLCGVATATRKWVRALEGTNCQVRDTRKTIPGLRQLEKYAVRCGGGMNHRMGLGDAALIKDNHIVAAGGITQAVSAIRESHPDLTLEVECDTLDQVLEAVDARCSQILLDNMDTEDIKSAVAIARRLPGVRVEASGGMTIENARAVADAGVDYIAVGSLTHSAVALDLGLDIVARTESLAH